MARIRIEMDEEQAKDLTLESGFSNWDGDDKLTHVISSELHVLLYENRHRITNSTGITVERIEEPS